jgi:type II secretory pathway predicted ATPase ExeA
MRIEPGLLTTPKRLAGLSAGQQSGSDTSAADYDTAYEFSAPPFGLEAARDPFPVFPSRRPVLQALLVGLRRDHGHILLIGDHGIGKSAVIEAALRQDHSLRDGTFVVPAGSLSPSLLTDHPGVTIIIDDAHALSPDLLIGFLKAAASQNQRVLLAGTPPLRQLLQDRQLHPFTTGIGMRLQLNRLTGPEVEQFIQHRLWRVGSAINKLLTGRALRLIVNHAQGNPGRVCEIMDRALASGFMRGDDQISHHTVLSVIQPLTASGRPSRPAAGVFNHLFTVVAVLVLILGIGLFLWTGLRSATPFDASATHSYRSPDKPSATGENAQ